MNFKLSSSNHGRKEKKKFKKLNNMTINSQNNDTQNSTTLSSKRIIDSKPKKRDSCFNCCKNSFNVNSDEKNKSECSIL